MSSLKPRQPRPQSSCGRPRSHLWLGAQAQRGVSPQPFGHSADPHHHSVCLARAVMTGMLHNPNCDVAKRETNHLGGQQTQNCQGGQKHCMKPPIIPFKVAALREAKKVTSKPRRHDSSFAHVIRHFQTRDSSFTNTLVRHTQTFACCLFVHLFTCC